MPKSCLGRVSGGIIGLAGFLVLAAPGVVSAQTQIQAIFQEQADSLRLQLVCQPDSAWPDLPRRPEATSIEAKVDSTGALSYLAGGGVVVSTTVQLPQYAYFFNPTSEACEPVIVLGADASGSFIYNRPSAKTAGAAPVVFFNLLGEDPPE